MIYFIYSSNQDSTNYSLVSRGFDENTTNLAGKSNIDGLRHMEENQEQLLDLLYVSLVLYQLLIHIHLILNY